MKQAGLLSILLSLAACASSPLQLDGVNRDITPAMITDGKPYTGQRVVWGGMIIQAKPLKSTTQVEVLAYPLRGDGEPERRASSLGRFLVNYRGFLDPANYQPGRWLTVVGRVGSAKIGSVGKARYRFPVIEPDQLHLWPLSHRSTGTTHFNFGIGIQF